MMTHHHSILQRSPDLGAGLTWGHLAPRGREEADLTCDGVNEVVELPLEDVQGVAQDLAVVGLALGNEVQLLLHGAADGGKHQLRIWGRAAAVSTLT